MPVLRTFVALALIGIPIAAAAADAPPPPPAAEDKECHCDGTAHACRCKDGGCNKHHGEAPGAPGKRPDKH